jgi:hypothetical protein
LSGLKVSFFWLSRPPALPPLQPGALHAPAGKALWTPLQAVHSIFFYTRLTIIYFASYIYDGKSALMFFIFAAPWHIFFKFTEVPQQKYNT